MKIIFIGVAGLLLGAFGFYLYSLNGAGPSAASVSLSQQEGPIKIGAILALSNCYATAIAESEQKSINMAIEETNAGGGINGRKVEIEYQDQQCDNPQAAISAYYNLRSQGINLILGPDNTPAATALSPLVGKDHVILFAATVGSEKFAPANDYTFDTWEADKNNSIALGTYLYSKGYRTIAILGSQQEWERTQAESVKEGFEAAGGTVGAIELPLVDNLDLRNEALRIKNSDPEVVVFTDYGEVMVAAQRIRAFGIKQPFYSVVFDDSQLAKARGALEETISISSFSPTPEFTAKFKNRYGDSPLAGTDSAYDAAQMLFTAIQNTSSTDPEKVKDGLQKIKTWDGASGRLTFDGFGGVHKTPRYYIVKGNTIVPFTP